MKKLFTIICSLLICLTASAEDNIFGKANFMCLGGSMKYGDEMRVLFGGGTKVDGAQFLFFYSKGMDMFSFDILVGDDTLLEVMAKFSDVSLNVDHENNRLRGLEVKYNGDTYRIFKAEELGAEIRSEKGGQSYVIDPRAVAIYALDDLDTPIASETNWLGGHYADNFYNYWLEYIAKLVKN